MEVDSLAASISNCSVGYDVLRFGIDLRKLAEHQSVQWRPNAFNWFPKRNVLRILETNLGDGNLRYHCFYAHWSLWSCQSSLVVEQPSSCLKGLHHLLCALNFDHRNALLHKCYSAWNPAHFFDMFAIWSWFHALHYHSIFDSHDLDRVPIN